MTGQHVLVVDDEPDIRELVQEILDDEGYEVTVAEDAPQAREQRRSRRPDLILLDIWMPGEDGISLLKSWQEAGNLPCPVIVMSGHGTVEAAVEATRLGAYDFIEKPLTMAKLLLSVRRALEADQLQRENVGLKRQSLPPGDPVGSSAMMLDLREHARRVAQHDTWVLITGEPGTGKEAVAHYIHKMGPRRERPFVTVGGAAVAREQSAIELFGSEDGDKIHYGLLEQSNAGMLFINDVADMDLPAQARLLSALESRNFVRVGGSESVEVNVRVVAATHRDLEKEVELGRFREDLYYRLNVVPLHVPRLRDHLEDIPELLNYYVDFYSSREGLPYRHFSIAAQNRLLHYAWPGNIRELRNLVQRLLILGNGEEIVVEEIESALGRRAAQHEPSEQYHNSLLDLPLREAREAFERSYLTHQLQQVGGSVGKLAQRIGMERTNLYRKLRALDIDPKKAASPN